MADANKGIRTLRNAMLFYLIGGILAIFALVLGLGSILLGSAAAGATGALGGALIAVVMILVVVVLEFISTIMMIIGIIELKNANKNYAIGFYGVILQFIAIILILIPVIASLLAGSLAAAGIGIFAFLIAALLSFVGAILVIIMFWRLGSDYNIDLVKIGGVLYLFIPPIGAILLYLGLNKMVK